MSYFPEFPRIYEFAAKAVYPSTVPILLTPIAVINHRFPGVLLAGKLFAVFIHTTKPRLPRC